MPYTSAFMLRLLFVFFLVVPALARPPGLTLQELRRRAASSTLESPQAYLKSAAAARELFLKQGGAVEVPSRLTTIILPDLHAQRDYLVAALALPMQEASVFDLLQRGKVTVVCLGDGMHAEGRAQERWLQAERDFLAGAKSSASMQAELVESLGLLKMVMDLKVAFPNNFYFVRGNHEDMNPQSPYAKFTRVGESNLVKHWVEGNLGKDFLRQWHACEQAMPLVALGGSFVGSHASPEAPLTVADAQARTVSAFRACCWSDNTRWSAGGPEEQTFRDNCRRFKVTPQRPWVVGHRKVEGALYRSQCDGLLIQINPLDSATRVYIVAPPAGQPLNPARNVRPLR